MVSISGKSPTKRTATAVCRVHFSSSTALPLIRENRAKKGDVLGVARIAGIMAAKRTADLIPLCHPIAITHVSVELEALDHSECFDVPLVQTTRLQQIESTVPKQTSIPWAGAGQGDAYKWSSPKLFSKKSIPSADNFGYVDIRAIVSCDGKTGVEMEALTAASMAALTVYDMCKAVDKGIRIEGLRVVQKEGGKSGTWVEGKPSSK